MSTWRKLVLAVQAQKPDLSHDFLQMTSGGLLKVDSSGATQPVSGTVTATQSGAWSTGRTWALSSGTDSVSAVFSGSVDTELPAVAALADATANPTTTNLAAYNFGYNGTTWDRLRSTTANGLAVDVTRVSGTVAVTQSGSWATGRTWSLSSGTDSVAVTGEVSATAFMRSTASAPTYAEATDNAFSSNLRGSLRVTDKPDVMEASHVTLAASTSTQFTFTSAVEVVRIKNWDTASRVLVKSSAISTDVDATASRVGKAPASDLPNSEFFPVSGTIFLRSTAASEVTVEGFRKSP